MMNYSKLKKLLYWFLLVAGILCILDFIFLISLNAGINVGIAFPAALGVFLILFSYLRLFRKVRLIRNVFIQNTIKTLTLLFILSFVIIEMLIWSSTQNEKNIKTDYVILLGAGLKGDQITVTFMNRMENCTEYLRENPKAVVVVTGGQGYGETITEAEAMEKYLIGAGISGDRIFKEDKATSTFENFKYSKEILEKKFGSGNYTIMIITNDFHMYRAKILARRTGFTAYGMPAKTWWGVFPNSCVREYFAVIKSFVVDR